VGFELIMLVMTIIQGAKWLKSLISYHKFNTTEMPVYTLYLPYVLRF